MSSLVEMREKPAQIRGLWAKSEEKIRNLMFLKDTHDWSVEPAGIFLSSICPSDPFCIFDICYSI